MKYIAIVTDETTENVLEADTNILATLNLHGYENNMHIYGSENGYGLVDVNLTVDYGGTTEQLESVLEDMFPAPTYSVSITDSWEDEN